MNNSLLSLLVILICVINLANFAVIRYDDGGTFDYTYDGLGNYRYKVDLSDQQKEEERIVDTSKAGEDSDIVHGEYSFSSGGKIYKVSYVADANGYRALTQVVKSDPRFPTTSAHKAGMPFSYNYKVQDAEYGHDSGFPVNPHLLMSILGKA